MSVGHGALTVPQFIEAYQLGRTAVYVEINSGRLRTYKVGRRRFISASAAHEWQKSLEDEAGAASAASQGSVVVPA